MPTRNFDDNRLPVEKIPAYRGFVRTLYEAAPCPPRRATAGGDN